jgi:hypothetical protein
VQDADGERRRRALSFLELNMNTDLMAVPLDRFVVRGSRDPWTMLRDGVARHLGIVPEDLPVDAVILAPRDFGGMNNEVRLYGMIRALSPEAVERLPRGGFHRGLATGFVYVRPAVRRAS